MNTTSLINQASASAFAASEVANSAWPWWVPILLLVVVAMIRTLYFLSDFLYVNKVLKRFDHVISNIGGMSNQEASERSYWFVEQKSRVRSLLENAGISDPIVPVVQPVGYGQMLTGQLGSMTNLGLFDPEWMGPQKNALHALRGHLKHKILESISPSYWLRTFVHLPQSIIRYVFPEAPNKLTGIADLIYWGISLFLAAKAIKFTDLTTIQEFFRALANH